MVDKAKLDQMLGNLRTYLGVLRRHASVPRDSFLADDDKIGSAKYHLLIEHGVLPAESGEALRAMARFRNRLVHLYWSVDDARVHEYLQESLDDLLRFGERVTRHAW